MLLEGLMAYLPLRWVYYLGEAAGGVAWHFMRRRRQTVIRNLRIAFAGELDIAEIHRMARASFRRVGANLFSVARTARLSKKELGEVMYIENVELLEDALAGGRGVVLLLSHMGNWELLSRLVHQFPEGSRAGAFYRPLNNPILDKRVLDRRQADGTRMFSKKDNPLHVGTFLREGGIVGILADQRVGFRGEVAEFFGRVTRASPLPSLLARRSRGTVLALSLTTVAPGKWKAVFVPVSNPPSTVNCMIALESAMREGTIDVFWLQERWKAYVSRKSSIRDWIDVDAPIGKKPHRALIWIAGTPEDWCPPREWMHPDVVYEVALESGRDAPGWLSEITCRHLVAGESDLPKIVATIDDSEILPLDFIVTHEPPRELRQACRSKGVPIVSLP